jgi:HD domain
MVRERAGTYFRPDAAEAYLRILSQVRPLADLAADVGAHHERLDGSGYPLGICGQRVPIGARVLAAADAWAERSLTGSPDLTGEDGLDAECVAALQSCARLGTRHQRQHLPGTSARRSSAPGNLRSCGCSSMAPPTPT